MLTAFTRWLPLALITLAAFWLRTRELDRRPMHADEANQAVKLGELLDAGRYQFDPRDHHGPTLYYAALPIAWLRGERSLAALTETTVRLVPALCGTISVLLLVAVGSALCRDGSALVAASHSDESVLRPASSHGKPAPKISLWWPALAAGMFMAVSPPAVYYSRYFIQETLLVTFTLAAFLCAWRGWRNGSSRWAIGAGICVGLMQATKASAPLFIVTAAVSAFLAFLLSGRGARGSKRIRRRAT